VRLSGGLVEQLGPPGTLPAATERLDLDGYLLLPAPAEPQAHLDTALTAERVPNPTGDLAGAITAWLAYQGSVTRDDFVDRATDAALRGLANGTTAIRIHVGIYETVGIKAVEALLEVREALRGLVDIQLVALNVRLTGPECADLRAMLRAAMELGADVVGGCPIWTPTRSPTTTSPCRWRRSWGVRSICTPTRRSTPRCCTCPTSPSEWPRWGSPTGRRPATA
jgi:cytosine/creatinine deaminase